LDENQGNVPRRNGRFSGNDGVAEASSEGHPPILVGGGFPQAARRAVRCSDPWAPIAGRQTEGDIDRLLPRFHQMLSEAGRNPATVAVALFHVTGGAEQLALHRDAGIARAVVLLRSANNDTILPILDRCAELIRRVA